MSSPGHASPEEIQRRLQEFLRRAMEGGGMSPQAAPASGIAASGEGDDAARPSFAFDYTPKQIKAHLDRFVIRQDEAKKVLSIAVCDHYHHVRHALGAEPGAEPAGAPLVYHKQNILMLGPTGVGKTYLVRCLADLIGVPMVKGDATKFTETGYVGGDVEDLVRDLVQEADGDVRLAQFGIIYLDEIDKLASASNANGRDVSGRGVQTNLLKLMEETDVPLRSQNDLQAQLQAAFDFQRRGGKYRKEAINTRHILFIVSGAFDRLEDMISRRLAKASIGFAAGPEDTREKRDELLEAVTTEDLIAYGLEPEFVGRLPVRVACSHLSERDLYDVMKYSEGSLIRQYEEAFEAYGIGATFTDDGLRAIAAEAVKERTGARALATVCERVLRDFKFELPGSSIRQLVVGEALVREPKKELERVLSDSGYERRKVLAVGAREFAAAFERRHGLRLELDDSAVEELVEGALGAELDMPAHCGRVFKDFEFGLTLVSRNSGQSVFPIDAQAVREPQKKLSEWVVASYSKRGSPEGPQPA